MRYARAGATGAGHALLDSGMPAPDAVFLADPAPPDLGPPSAAMAELEVGLARHLLPGGPAEPPAERILGALGTSGALHLAAAHWFRPGTRVAVELPSYEVMRALPAFFGADTRTVERRADRAWDLDPADVRAALAGAPGPGHVFVTNPHNPTGAVLSPERVVDLAAVASEAGGLLVCDEVYMEYAPPERRFRALELAPNAVSLGSLTKAYGLGALRIGWVALAAQLVDERAALEDTLALDYVDPPSVALRLGLRALAHLDRLHARIGEVERASKPVLADWLARTPRLEGELPEWGLICFPRVVEVADTRDLTAFLAAEFDLDVVAGEFFGRPGHLRLCFGQAPDRLRAALEQLDAGVAAYLAR